MIYITGDTHIPVDIQKLSTKFFPEQRDMSKDDYVIICGDFGGIWNGGNEEKYWLNWLRGKNFTTLFIDGNHENFDMLNSLPVVEFAGGRAHKIDRDIYHLMRGEIYTIKGKKFFTFGGGASHDRKHRKEGKNWWPQEMPSDCEYENGLRNLEGCNHCVDYVITHTAPEDVQRIIAPEYEENKLTEYLLEIKSKLTYEKWFFGHYHKDLSPTEKDTAVFNRRILL